MSYSPHRSSVNDILGLSRPTFDVLCLCIFALVLILVGLGGRSPWPADEPRFALIAQEMWHSGQWLFPARGGELYPDKPPVFMWAIALFYGVTGSINLAFLLPSALAGFITILAVYDLGRRLWSHRIGLWAGALLITSFQFMLQAKTAQIDALVCCWITLGCYGLLRHLLEGPHWGWYTFAGFSMGLGVITKGVGFLPLLMLIPYAVVRLYQPKSHEVHGGWRWGLAPLFMLVAILLWVGPLLWSVDAHADPAYAAYRDNLLFRQTATRYVHSLGHVKPWYYYLVSVIPFLWLPLSLFFPGLAKHWWQDVREGDRRVILPLVWAVLVIVFFSISPGKRGVYMLPALPMMALIAAPYIENMLARLGYRRAVILVIALLTSVLLLAGIAGMLEMKPAFKLQQKYELDPWAFACALGVMGAASLWVLRRTGSVVAGWVLFITGFWCLYSTWGYSLLESVKTPKAVLAEATPLLPKEATLGFVDFREQFLFFSPYHNRHFGFHTPAAIQQQSAWQWMREHPEVFLVAPRGKLAQCFDENQAVMLGLAHRADWLLFSNTSIKPECAVADTVVAPFIAPDIH